MNFTSVAIFFGLQLINVILSTVRSILTIKSSKTVASIVSAVSYTFYSAIVKLMTSQDLVIVVSTTFVTNIIGVWVAMVILDKFKKDKLWVFNATFKCRKEGDNIQKILDAFQKLEIKYIYNEVTKNQLYTIQIFSENQSESVMITEILRNYEIKFYAIESKI